MKSESSSINLLPNAARRKAAWEYRRRMVAVAGFLAAGVWAVGALLMMPAYLAASLTKRGAERQLTAVEENIADPSIVTGAHAEDQAKNIFDAALALAKGPRPSAIIDLFTQVSPEGIALREVNYKVGGGSVSVVLAGIADARDDLLAFTTALQKIPGVASAVFPAADLAASSTVAFSITITYAPPATPGTTPN